MNSLKITITPSMSLQKLIRINPEYSLFSDQDLSEIFQIARMKAFKNEGEDKDFEEWINALAFDEVNYTDHKLVCEK